MRKWSICKLAVILILSIKSKADAQEIELLKTTHLANYPSASALEFYKGALYVTGDDATHVLLLDKDYHVKDSIVLFRSPTKRISKATKPDLEASLISSQDNGDYLVLVSSFSTRQRNKVVLIHLPDKNVRTYTTSAGVFANGIKQINIEGAALVKNNLVLSNRANNTSKNNYLLISSIDLKNGVKNKIEKTARVILPATKKVIGISGLAYIAEKDLLLFTASTENTANAYKDGEIGKSYIGYIFDASQKIKSDSVVVEKLIDLTNYLSEKEPQKIESIAVESGTEDDLVLHLAADNDNGESTLFKIRLRLK